MPTHIRASVRRTASRTALAVFAAGLAGSFTTVPAHAQEKAKSDKAKEDKEPKGEKKVPALFTSEAPLAITFKVNVKQIRRDKGAEPPWRWASFT